MLAVWTRPCLPWCLLAGAGVQLSGEGAAAPPLAARCYRRVRVCAYIAETVKNGGPKVRQFRCDSGLEMSDVFGKRQISASRKLSVGIFNTGYKLAISVKNLC